MMLTTSLVVFAFLAGMRFEKWLQFRSLIAMSREIWKACKSVHWETPTFKLSDITFKDEDGKI